MWHNLLSVTSPAPEGFVQCCADSYKMITVIGINSIGGNAMTALLVTDGCTLCLYVVCTCIQYIQKHTQLKAGLGVIV